MDVKNTHSVTKTEISVFGRQALDAERRRSPSLADKVLNIYIDLSKAFDTLDHNILISKLQHYGFKGAALQLLISYLSNRKQFVQYGDTLSQKTDILMGVPQGSILGPLLFIIYINDMAHSSGLFKFINFADDTTLITNLTTKTRGMNH